MESLKLSLDTVNGNLSIPLKPGEALYILGANGAGKSTLLYRWATHLPNSVLISGNRDITLESSSISISAAQANNEATYAKSEITQPKARYAKSYHNNESWLRTLFFRLKTKGDYLNDQYRKADQQNDIAKKKQILETMPMELLNKSFQAAHLPLEFEWSEKSELLVKKQGVEHSYEMNKMSDGERSACILAVQTILAPENTILLIDEPERHLHRSISAPLISHLRAIRPDLCWAIASHDISLAREEPTSPKLLVYDFSDGRWNADLVTNFERIDHILADAIYGAKEKILFVEGQADSLDTPLYKLIFNNITIVPAGSCKEVEQAVLGLKNVDEIHHMEAFGIVDADNRADLARLESIGIHALKLYAIESIYYHRLIINSILAQAGTELTYDQIIDAACSVISDNDIKRLSNDAAYKRFRTAYLNSIPSINDFTNGTFSTTPPSIDFEKPENLELAFLQMIQTRNWDSILKSFKIKSTGAPNEIARKLGYTNSAGYIIAVKKLLAANDTLRASLSVLVPNPFKPTDTQAN